MISFSSGYGALWRQALGESLLISAVVVDHVVPLHPPHPLLACGIQILVPPVSTIRFLRRTVGSTGRPNTSISIKISVGGSEGGFGPVRLDAATLRRPVISIPEAGVDPHGLVLWKRNTLGLHILEVSDRCAINHESESINKSKVSILNFRCTRECIIL